MGSPQSAASPAESKVRGDVEQTWRGACTVASPAGRLPQSSFLSAPVQVSTLETVESYPQLTNHSLSQLMFTLVWPLAPQEAGVSDPGDMPWHRGGCRDSGWQLSVAPLARGKWGFI